MDREPSVLDYLKSRLRPWRAERIQIPPAQAELESEPQLSPEQAWQEPREDAGAPVLTESQGGVGVPFERASPVQVQPDVPAGEQTPIQVSGEDGETLRQPLPVRALLALVLVCLAQYSLNPVVGAYSSGALLLLSGVLLAVWAGWRGEWRLSASATMEAGHNSAPIQERRLNLGWLAASLLFGGLAFLLSGQNRMSWASVISVGLSLAALVVAAQISFTRQWEWLKHFGLALVKPAWRLSFSRRTLWVLLAVALVVFFRFYRLDSVPAEMVSDHAEKFLDVRDILSGNPLIFFPRNGGREALQFYLLSFLVATLGLTQNFLTLKISTALVGALSLPFIYLAGKEYGGRRTGMLAFLLAGTAYWTNVVARAGMRLPFYMLFTAALLYFLLRGLQRRELGSIIAAGVTLGLSLYGYSADRILPVLVLLAVGLYLLSPSSRAGRYATSGNIALLVLCALLVFTPLLRYILDDPTGFSGRMFSRIGSSEQPLPGPALTIFLDNQWRALQMFSLTAGVIWPVSIPNSPALNVVSGGLFYLGLALAALRALRKRNWQDSLMVLMIPILMLPSTLSLAFPGENPNLYRTGGAAVPVFLLAALALDGLIGSLERSLNRPSRWLGWAVALLLLLVSASQDYQRVFVEYAQQYQYSAWNYSEVGRVIRDFDASFGSSDGVWVVGFPHWLDTRLVALEAGTPLRDYAIFIDQLPQTTNDSNPKLFILNPTDQPGLDALKALYPNGWAQIVDSQVETKDFWVFFAPPILEQP